jgi:uncharacterized damage-inducible protein DinB
VGQWAVRRQAEDRRIIDFVDGLDDGRIASTIRSRRVSSPQEFEQQLAPAPAHWFNHQTHHRGQVHALLWPVKRRSLIFCFSSVWPPYGECLDREHTPLF